MDLSASTSRPHYRVPRRVATAPIPLRESMRASSPPSGGLVETLYNHPNAKIIAFTASGRVISRGSGDISLAKDDQPGTLSWSSQIERTIAVGPFRIYRAPGSVAFLNCGSALQPILPKSQCWCIDEVNSKFVLQIRRPNYWRIELPVANPEEQQLAESLKGVFDKILQFEKTECPFKRSFTVVLPDQPQTPVKKRPWTPVRRSLPNSPTVEPITPGSPIMVPRRSSLVPQTSTLTRPNKRYPDLSELAPKERTQSPVQDTEPKTQLPAVELAGRGELIERGRIQEAGLEHPKAYPKIEKNLHLESQKAVAASMDPVPPVKENMTSIDTLGPEVSRVNTSNLETVPKPPPLRCTPLSPDDHDITFPTNLPNQLPSPTDDESSVYILHEGSGYQKGQMKARLRRSAGFKTMRSTTMPTHMMKGPAEQPWASSDTRASNIRPSLPHSESTQTVASHYSDAPSSTGKENTQEPRLLRRGSDDSFHSVESWHSPSAPVPASPLTSHPDSPVESFKPSRELDVSFKPMMGQDQRSEAPSSAGMPCAWETDDEDEESVSSQESVTTAPDIVSTRIAKEKGMNTVGAEDAAKSDVVEPVRRRRPAASHRATTSSISSVGRRALSPLPPAANLFTPVAVVERRPILSKLETVRKIPMAIISKTCEMLIGPPSHLITLMLKVAAKIAAGQWRGLVYGYDDFGEQIPVHWDYSEGEFSDWSDDEPYMTSHHKHGERHGHRSHHGNQHDDDGDTAKPTGESLAEQPESSDDSRSWGVD